MSEREQAEKDRLDAIKKGQVHMTAARGIESRGVRVLAEGDALTLEGLAALTPEQASEVLAFARQNKARLIEELGGPSGLPWPEPEPFPLVVRSVPWKYACLWAIVSHFGAALTKDTGGGLTLACPATMPQAAAQAARDGLAELTGYIRRRPPDTRAFLRPTGRKRHRSN